MKSICLYLHVHQPYRLKQYQIFDVGNDHDYFNQDDETDLNNARILRKVASKSYLPTLKTFAKIRQEHPDFSISLSFSGTVLDQFSEHQPEVLEAFQEFVAGGGVEILADTYHHSLSFFYSRKEFERQVLAHREKIEQLFNQTPMVMRNTELSYNNDLAQWAERHGFTGIMAEGFEKYLGDRSPNLLYQPIGTSDIKVLLKNYRLSDDIAFRFGQKSWKHWPLTPEKFATWAMTEQTGETLNLFMDFETFGEHQWEDTGIFRFLRNMPSALRKHHDVAFMTASQTLAAYQAHGEFDVPDVLTWADTERDLTAWTGNDIQKAALREIYALEDPVVASGDERLIEDWRRLQTSDHFYYMCTKWLNDGDVHAYFSPYESPYQAFMGFMNAVADLKNRLVKAKNKTPVSDKEVRVLHAA